MGFHLYGGAGPSFEMRDPAYGYSATVGFNFYWKYFGIELDIAWYSHWAEDTKRSDHNDTSYFLTNTAGLLMGHGYIPASDHFVVKLGAGIGVGQQYARVFSDQDITESGTAWMARLQVGMLYLFDNHATIGFDVQFHFGEYVEVPLPRPYWRDHEQDRSVALVIMGGFDFVM